MTEFVRRFRGFGVAAVVLALSAGAVFATSASLPTRTSAPAAAPQTESDEPTEAPETEDPSDDPTEAPETEEPSADADAATAPEDTHGALVSEAAQMETPDGFANHGAFVSCVAHMKDATLATIVWADVTAESCAAAAAQATTDKLNAKAEAGKAKGDAGKAKGAAGKAKGAAHRAAAQAGH